MSSEHPADDAAEIESGRELIQLGAETLAGSAGAAAGAFLGPPGALAGAAAGPTLVRAVAWAGRTVKTRLLSRNEEVRIGTALYVALEQIKEREDMGEQPRGDGLFDPGSDPRGMLEGTLLSAARSYDQKKVPFIGSFYASFAFEEGISISAAHFLLSLLDRLTYRHLCDLAYFADPGSDEERIRIQTAAEEEGVEMSEILVAELTELANIGLLGVRQDDGNVSLLGSTVGTLGGAATISAYTMGELAPMELGKTLVVMADLSKIPAADKEDLKAELHGYVA